MAIEVRRVEVPKNITEVYEVPRYVQVKDRSGATVEIQQGADRYTVAQLQATITNAQAILDAINALPKV